MNLFENILTPKAKLAFSQTWQAIGNAFQPVANTWNQVIQQNKQAIKPAVQKVTQVATKMAEPIIKPIQRNSKIAKVNSFLADKWLTVEHIRTLAEMDWTNPDEAIKSLQDMGIKVKGMDEIVATQKHKQNNKQKESYEVMQIEVDFYNKHDEYEQI